MIQRFFVSMQHTDFYTAFNYIRFGKIAAGAVQTTSGPSQAISII
jgi:hypothetical protein